LLLGGRLHEPPEGGAGVGAGLEPGDGVGVGLDGPPRIGVGVGCGVGSTTGIATGDCDGDGFGSLGLVGIASFSAWHPRRLAATRTTTAIPLGPTSNRRRIIPYLL
jgi:hypothetical protein